MGDPSKLGRWSLLLVATSCLLLPACTDMHVCTLKGGYDGLILDVEVDGALPPDNYTIVARVDGVEARLDEMIMGSGSKPTVYPEPVIDGKHLLLQAALFNTGYLQVGFREGGGPAEVTVEIRRGTAMLVQATYMPTYVDVFPNGEDCPPPLQQARDILVIPAPAI